MQQKLLITYVNYFSRDSR